jgi:CheY-like chemotaxis protein
LPCELITIDLTMPGMDGFELAETIQEKHLSPPPRLIMVTATDTAALDERISAAGFSGIVSKPVTAAQIGKVIGNGGPAASAARAPLAGLQILLVEDIPTNQLIAVEILESYGATVDTADNGRLALNRLIDEGRRYDAVLMDIQMPELDGLEATRRLRASGRWPGLPVIAMTAHALPEEKSSAAGGRMNDSSPSRSIPKCCATRCCAGARRRSRPASPPARPRPPRRPAACLTCRASTRPTA